MPEIEAKNIVKYFKHDKHVLKAIDGINLVANSGEFVCIVGPSGCGKSTFLRILAGLEASATLPAPKYLASHLAEISF